MGIKVRGLLGQGRKRSSTLDRHRSSKMPWLPISITALVLLNLTNTGDASLYSSDGGFEEMLGLRSCEPQCPEQHGEEQQSDRSPSKMLSALFEFGPSTPHPTEMAMAMPHQLPPMYYNDFYEDLLTTKRNDVHSAGCDCKVTNELVDLGSMHYPRYLMNAVCESGSGRNLAKCTHGSNCRPLEYKVKVLTQGTGQTDPAYSWMNKDQPWQFKTVTVTAGCFCAK
ncbi:uncharacterized protein LOC119546649 isoform X1 [Drosophila subpulchrella]|uniref:uncharacterized protein LOC119546649 isoform X1 n=1 Tax=Drosophila subpulchrella TaxID=1486046 RepID=UPI0018A15039|nr:uncharacterized protein LOC119546649 isoform X1 [Drosophila subpulchrella]XP_037709025.1 uncharacterized protein LOC119546649 isoform X1 [Drosophila subpulchrella]XP_037709027.1 uncharacterized protein LOC119546649 isoform X1 [Drosophila subpulchrella]XP_037709028.1 uncharacterized protein LOC119546649 isoform X1 [Drosophila subpulchrella]XP_037709029.1 uncharacterized protein LOC119546649 isoform X1 [Drosophila subpulchrella]XP_037709030.1 uncharacterized protein LOC119546649 isoform X1 [D